MFILLMNEFCQTNFSHGICLLWSIFRKISTNKNCRSWLDTLGIVRLISFSIDFSRSQNLANDILQTLKNMCIDVGTFKVKLGPKFVGSLLNLIDTCNEDNLLLIIDLLGFTGIEESDKAHKEDSKKMIKKVLEIGISSPNSVKFAILTVVEKMFNSRNLIIADKMNSERIMLLIISALNHGETSIKETASVLTLKMIVTENIDLTEEPDLLNLVLLNCKLLDNDFFRLRRLSIEVIFRMAVSVKYMNIIVLNANQILDMVKTSISILHPEVSSGLHQSSFIVFNRVRIDDNPANTDSNAKEEESMNFAGKIQGFKDRVIQAMNLQGDSLKIEDPGEDKEDIEEEVEDSDQEDLKVEIKRKGFFMSKEDKRVVDVTKDLIQHYDLLCNKNSAGRIDMKGAELYTSTYHLVKIMTILLSCDITYTKVFSMSLHAVCGIVLEKSIGARVKKINKGNGGCGLHHNILLHAFRYNILQTW